MGREFIDIFDGWIESYDASVAGEDPEYRDVFEGYDEILEKVANQSVGTVLEFGTGTGNLTAKLVEKGLSVVGVEPNHLMRKFTSQRFPTLTIIDGDLLDFDVDGFSFDTIVSSFVFHHLTDVEKGVALKKYAELLEENGKVIFADTMFITEDAKAAQIVKERSRDFHKVADDLEREYYTTVPVLMDLFINAGFDVECKQMNDYAWILTAVKRTKSKH